MRQRLAGALLAAIVIVPGVSMGEIMTKEEIEDELMGVTVSGVIEGTDLGWRECIDREGATFYEVEGERARPGRILVTDGGLACFSYGAIASCFTVMRDGPYYALVDAVDRFLIQRIERPVRRCTPANDAVS
ncbi:MAG: hypothetical protein AAF253_00735 [Pseudomonadota bacterium]